MNPLFLMILSIMLSVTCSYDFMECDISIPASSGCATSKQDEGVILQSGGDVVAHCQAGRRLRRSKSVSCRADCGGSSSKNCYMYCSTKTTSKRRRLHRSKRRLHRSKTGLANDGQAEQRRLNTDLDVPEDWYYDEVEEQWYDGEDRPVWYDDEDGVWLDEDGNEVSVEDGGLDVPPDWEYDEDEEQWYNEGGVPVWYDEDDETWYSEDGDWFYDMGDEQWYDGEGNPIWYDGDEEMWIDEDGNEVVMMAGNTWYYDETDGVWYQDDGTAVWCESAEEEGGDDLCYDEDGNEVWWEELEDGSWEDDEPWWGGEEDEDWTKDDACAQSLASSLINLQGTSSSCKPDLINVVHCFYE